MGVLNQPFNVTPLGPQICKIQFACWEVLLFYRIFKDDR